MMYPREEVVRKKKLGLHKTSMDKVVGLCHVRPKENSKEDDLVKWTDKGEDRFFVDKLYIADSETFEPLQSHVIEELKQTLTLWPAPILKEVSALNSMDIFSGCGGLSVGLGQAGVANNEWAKDISEPAAEAYKKNFPDAEVYNQECNSFLK